MTDPREIIHAACNELGCYAPKVVTYHNGTLVVIRNGDGERVADIIEPTLDAQAIKHRILQLYKVKAENQPSKATMERLIVTGEDVSAVIAKDPKGFAENIAKDNTLLASMGAQFPHIFNETAFVVDYSVSNPGASEAQIVAAGMKQSHGTASPKLLREAFHKVHGRLLSPEEIRAYQEGKKAANSPDS